MLPSEPKKPVPGSKGVGTVTENGSRVNVPAPMPIVRVTPADGMGPGLPPALSSMPSAATLLHGLRRRWFLAVTAGLLCAALTVLAVWLLMPPKYTSVTLLRLSSRAARGVTDGDTDFINFQKTQQAVVKSYSVLHAALEKPEIATLGEVQAHGDPIAWLQKELVSDFLLGPEVFRLSLGGENPEEIAKVLNAVQQAYLRDFADKEKGRVAERIMQVQAGYDLSAETLRDKRQKLQRKEEDAGVESREAAMAKYSAAIGELARLQSDLRLKRSARASAEAELTLLQAREKNPDAPVSELAMDDELQKEPIYGELVRTLFLIEAEIQHVKAITAPAAQTGAVRKLLSDKEAIETAMEKMKKDLRPRMEARVRARRAELSHERSFFLQSQVPTLREEEKLLDQELKKQQSVVDTFKTPDKVPSDIEALRDEVKQMGLILDKLGGELGDLRLEQSTTPRVTLEEEAKVPVKRTMDKQLKFGGVAAFGAFGFGILGIALLEVRSRRVYAADDVVQGLGMNLIGTLPALPPRARRALPAATAARDQHWQSIMTESVDAIRTLLLHSAQNDSLRVVMVTSAQGGEGKTSLASHLAASLARAWRKTLLLDCDLRNPAAHKQFDLPLEPGFSEVLRGEVEFDDVVRPTPVSRLWMIPAGQWDSHAVQALAQEGVANIFERLKEQYDFIVIDACPVLPVADSLLIGQHADAVLFSVLRDVSRTPAVYAAHQRLATLGIHMLGAVVIGENGDSYGRPYHYPAQTQG